MKRLHVHVAVDDLSQAVKFYSTLFAAGPTVTKSDYAKWMLDDPRVNFAISMRGAQPGLNHLGIQVESQDELHEVYDRLGQQADRWWSRNRPSAAITALRRHGLTILRVFFGRRSSPRERARCMATAGENPVDKHVTHLRRVPSLPQPTYQPHSPRGSAGQRC
jgi:catechol 2,3-dioxygenase-like lactoylglutathione lyase family enzyme